MITRRFFLLTGSFLSITSFGLAQNLVINPGAEASPAAIGWTVSSLGVGCAAGTAAATFDNWTMTPDNSANYPNAHGGIKTFFAGCSPTASTSYELYQDIDVSADATQIDVSNVEFVFSGYIQTPVNTQADAGRFTVDFLNASDVVLGTSYTASQSNSGGSGVTWNFYTNTRTAPVGTRKVRIRLIASISATPAINAYFDDISLVKDYLVALPITLLSFNAKSEANQVVLNWDIADAVNFDRFEVEQSTDQQKFVMAGIVRYKTGTTHYSFADNQPTDEPIRYYRLKMIDIDGRVAFSRIVSVKGIRIDEMVLTPNPATGNMVIKGLTGAGTITISMINGLQIAHFIVRGPSIAIDVNHLPKGMYLVTYKNKDGVITGKLVVK